MLRIGEPGVTNDGGRGGTGGNCRGEVERPFPIAVAGRGGGEARSEE